MIIIFFLMGGFDWRITYNQLIGYIFYCLYTNATYNHLHLFMNAIKVYSKNQNARIHINKIFFILCILFYLNNFIQTNIKNSIACVSKI